MRHDGLESSCQSQKALVCKTGQKVSIFLEVDMQEVERRVHGLGEEVTEAQRLAKLFNVPESVFPPGVDVYTALAAHSLGKPPEHVTKLERNYVKARLVEWLYNGGK